MNIFFPPDQEVVFFSFLILGLLLGFVYDLFVVKRKLFFDGLIWCLVDDIIFVVICGIFFLITAFIVNNGIIRWYEFLCCIIGFALYKNTVSKLILKIFGYVIDFIHRIVLVIIKFTFSVICFVFKPIISVFIRMLTPVLNLLIENFYIQSIFVSFKSGIK